MILFLWKKMVNIMLKTKFKNIDITITSVTVLLLLLHSILFYPIYPRLIQAWRDMPQCSHGYFVWPITLGLFYWKYKSCEGYSVKPSYTGCVITSTGLVLYVAALLYESDTLAYGAYMVSLAGIFLSIYGFKMFRLFLFPYLFLFFMFPIPNSVYLSLTGSLKLFASAISAGIISGFGIPVLREGNIIALANVQLSVVEACSGMQSLVSYVMLGSLLAYFMGGAAWKRGALMAVTIPVALVNNIMRITGTGIMAELYGQEAISGTLHEAFGVLVFVLGFMVLISTYLLLVRINRNPCVSS